MNKNTGYNEQEVLTRLRAGDQAAHRILFNAHFKDMLDTAYRILQDKSRSKDMVHDVFLKLWQNSARLDIRTSIESYLLQAVRNSALNDIKSNRKYILNEPEDWSFVPDDSAADIDEKMKKEDQENALRQAIELLPEKCKLVFMLSRFEKMSHKEIADHLDISTKTIENQITKAMKILRAALTGHPELSAIVIWAINSLNL